MRSERKPGLVIQFGRVRLLARELAHELVREPEYADFGWKMRSFWLDGVPHSALSAALSACAYVQTAMADALSPRPRISDDFPQAEGRTP